jgi:hypothetical protein
VSAVRVPQALKPMLRPVADRVLPSRRERRARDKYRRNVTALLGDAVLSGPFTGMRLLPSCLETGITPYILGSYEAELHNDIESVIAASPDVVVDIGCAEGYYAVGFATRLPKAVVYASDIDPAALSLCEANARLNGVADRVRIIGALTPAKLDDLAAHQAFILSDCEGCELDLLDPAVVSNLRRTRVIVELHDFIDATISERIQSRFSATHRITVVDVAPRRHDDYPWVSEADFDWAVDESRPVKPHPMQWAVLVPLMGQQEPSAS